MLSRHPIAETLGARISIADVLGETVDLARTGEELRGECSAHRDRARGLFVHEAKGFYHCFSCGWQGDVVQWVMETARCSEEAAIAILGQRVGLQSRDDSPLFE